MRGFERFRNLQSAAASSTGIGPRAMRSASRDVTGKTRIERAYTSPYAADAESADDLIRADSCSHWQRGSSRCEADEADARTGGLHRRSTGRPVQAEPLSVLDRDSGFGIRDSSPGRDNARPTGVNRCERWRASRATSPSQRLSRRSRSRRESHARTRLRAGPRHWRRE